MGDPAGKIELNYTQSGCFHCVQIPSSVGLSNVLEKMPSLMLHTPPVTSASLTVSPHSTDRAIAAMARIANSILQIGPSHGNLIQNRIRKAFNPLEEMGIFPERSMITTIPCREDLYIAGLKSQGL